MSESLLSVGNLHVRFTARASDVQAVRGVSFAVQPGTVHALVGESGSGKSVTAKAILGLLPTPPAVVRAQSIEFEGRQLLSLPRTELRSLRGRKIAMIFQEPGKHLNPSFTIGSVVREMLTVHLGMTRAEAARRAEELMELVELQHGRSVLESYPHELSGGMKQRALIAMAISCNPSLLFADEPTTSLDVTVQRQILDLLDRLRREMKMGILFVSHDLSVVQQISDYVSVIYAGRILESAPADELFAHPLHPYTDLLLRAIPEPGRRGRPLEAIPGRIPDAQAIPSGCAFHPRCPLAQAVCADWTPSPESHRESHLTECRRIAEVILPQEASR